MRRFVCVACSTVSWSSARRTPVRSPLARSAGSCSPLCNVVTVQVTKTGGVYRLEGSDDECGASTVAPVVGIARAQPRRSITLASTT